MDTPKFLIIPNSQVISYAQVIQECVSKIGLEAIIDMQFHLKLAERLNNTETYIVIAIGKRNRDNKTLQIRLADEIHEITLEHFIKNTLALLHDGE